MIHPYVLPVAKIPQARVDKAVCKLAQLTLGTGLGELLDHSNFGGEGLYAVLVHVVAQEL